MGKHRAGKHTQEAAEKRQKDRSKKVEQEHGAFHQQMEKRRAADEDQARRMEMLQHNQLPPKEG